MSTTLTAKANVGAGTELLPVESIGGVLYPLVKIGHGVDGSYVDASATNPLPVIDPDATATGTITTKDNVLGAPDGAGTLLSGASPSTSIVSIACPGGDSAWIIQVTGTFNSNTVYWEESLDSTNGIDGNWIAVNGRQAGIVASVIANGTTTAGIFRGNTAGAKYLRARAYHLTNNPTLTVTIRISSGTGAIFLNAPVTQANITKGTQGTAGVTTQDLKDAGRNQTNYFTAAMTLNTATDTLQSLTGYKGGAAVTATTTPAVVTAGKTLRIKFVTLTYITTAAPGVTKFTLRANLSGVVAITSPAVDNWFIGGTSSATAGLVAQMTIPIPDGMEFAAGTGIGVSAISYNATGVATATGYSQISLHGYEY